MLLGVFVILTMNTLYILFEALSYLYASPGITFVSSTSLKVHPSPWTMFSSTQAQVGNYGDRIR